MPVQATVGPMAVSERASRLGAHGPGACGFRDPARYAGSDASRACRCSSLYGPSP